MQSIGGLTYTQISICANSTRYSRIRQSSSSKPYIFSQEGLGRRVVTSVALQRMSTDKAHPLSHFPCSTATYLAHIVQHIHIFKEYMYNGVLLRYVSLDSKSTTSLDMRSESAEQLHTHSSIVGREDGIH